MENHLYFKITTLPQTSEENLTEEPRELQLFYNKYKEAKKLDSWYEACLEYFISAAKNPTFGRIYSITTAYVKDGQINVKVLKGGEKAILQTFLNMTSQTTYKITLWNAEFVLPFLSTRAAKNKITATFHKDIYHYAKRAWNLSCLDLYAHIRGVGWYQPSLEETAFNFNLETDFVSGEDVYTTWKAGEERLDLSSVEEIKTLINIHRLLEKEEPLEEVYSSVVVLEEDVEEQKMGLMDRIFQKGEVTKELEKELLEKIKNYSEDDKKETVELLKGTLGVRKVNAALTKKILK